MTYCLGILLREGLLVASDSRTNAGIDQIATVAKQSVFETPGERLIVVLSAGNLATTQAVVAWLRQAYGNGDVKRDLTLSATLFDAAQKVGDTLRDVIARESGFVSPYGDPSASFIVAGQIAGENPRLFQIYSAGNFMEATMRTPFVQIGETKYGKPILDRLIRFESSLTEAAKLALLSFDATARSNLSVGPPFDVTLYETDKFSAARCFTFAADDPYFTTLSKEYSIGLGELTKRLPEPPL